MRMNKLIVDIATTLSLLFACGALAEEVRDPTRPPAIALSGTVEPLELGAPMLQSVLVGPERRSAIINGQVLQVGARVGDARLVKIEEDRVILSSGGMISTLYLFPAVGMKLIRGEPKADLLTTLVAPPKKNATRKPNRTKPVTDPTQ